jgi:hypothetical protein
VSARSCATRWHRHLREFAAELKNHAVEATVQERFAERAAVRLEVLSDGEIDFVYEVRAPRIRCRMRGLTGQALDATGR